MSSEISKLEDAILKASQSVPEAWTTLAGRFNALIERGISPPRWKALEDMSGIPAASWRRAYVGKQRPTAEMIETLARHEPQCAFWLVTGVTDTAGGHLSPEQRWPETLDEYSHEHAKPKLWALQVRLQAALSSIKRTETPDRKQIAEAASILWQIRDETERSTAK